MIQRLKFLIAIAVFLGIGSGVEAQDVALRKQLTKRLPIEEIVIEGNTAFSEKLLKSKLHSNEDGFWQGLKLKRVNRYTKASYARDRLLLEYFYKSEGYDDATVEIGLRTGKKPEKIIVHITIKEGVRYRIGKVEVNGAGSEEYPISVVTHPIRAGTHLNTFAINVAKNAIKTIFANKGYPYAEITIAVDKDTTSGIANLTVNILRNQLVLFGDIVVDTNLTTQPRVFYREITFKRDDVYTRDKYFESQQRLIRTGLFNFVSLELPDSMSSLDSLQPNFYVRAVERPPRYAGFGVGAGQDKDAGIALNALGRFGDRNIGGSARKIGMSVTTSFTMKDSLIVRPNFQFSYTEPYFFKIRMPLILTFEYEPRATSNLRNYRVRSFSFDATAIREFSLKTKLSTSLNYEEVNLDTAGQQVDDQTRRSAGINVNRRIILLLERDGRPIQSRFNPSSGSYTSYRFEYVGGILGGDNDFIKFVWNWSKYNQWNSTTIYASRLRFGYVNEFGTSDNVPILERFYLGGAYTIRGFPENEFGPQAIVIDDEGDTSNVFVGGEAIAMLNLEVRKQLVGKIWGSYFIDTGINASKLREVDFHRAAITTGVGVQFMSPVGPIRLDYGHRIGINNIHAGGHFHIGILYAF